MACAACGKEFGSTMYLDAAKKVYGDKVYRDFKSRGYKDYNSICTGCLRECKDTLEESST